MNTDLKPGQGYDVYISYHSADLDTATSLAEQLRSRKRRVFLSSDSARAGDRVFDTIARAIGSSTAVLVLVSTEYEESQYARLELELALQRAESGQALLVPVALPGVGLVDLPKQLAQYQGVSVRSSADIAAAASIVDRSVAKSDQSPAPDQEQSVALLEQALGSNERLLGPDHPSTLSTRASLANVILETGHTVEAAELLEQTLADSKRLLDPDHPSTLSSRANLANVYMRLGKTADAAALLEQTLADSERLLGPDHPSTLSTRANLANVYLGHGRTADAAALLEQTLADSERVLGPDHSLTLEVARLREQAGDPN